jgi:hypothetical protein
VRVHLGNVELLEKLVRYFGDQPDCVVHRVGEREIEVSLLGSWGASSHEQAIEQLLTEFWARPDGAPRSPSNGNGHGANGNGHGANGNGSNGNGGPRSHG